MKKLFTTTLFTLLLGVATPEQSQAQAQKMSLAECMQYAAEHSVSVQTSNLNRLSAKQDRTQAIASMFPSLGASVGLNNSWGRSIDPETNTYGTSSNLSNSYNVSASMTIFDGLANINTLKASKVRVEGSEYELQRAKDQKMLDVMQLYYDVLYYEQSVALTLEQLESAQAVLKLTESQNSLGLKSEADVALARSEEASFDLLLTQQQSNLTRSELSLKEAMNYPLDEALDLEEQQPIIEKYESSSDFDLANNIDVLIANNEVKNSELSLKISRGYYLPSIGVSAGYGTNFFQNFGSESPVIAFGEQLSSNYGYYVGASLSIPIFNGLSRRTSVNKQKYSLAQTKLQAEQTMQQTKKAALESLNNQESAYKEFKSAGRKIEASDLAYRAMCIKYEEGMVSIIDLQKTSNELLAAKATRLRTSLNYLKESIMVDYYLNGKL